MRTSKLNPANRILRRVRRRPAYLTRLLSVIRRFRGLFRTPAHLAAASQARLRLDHARSLAVRASLLAHRQAQLQRDICIVLPPPRSRRDREESLQRLRLTLAAHRHPSRNVVPVNFEREITNRDRPLRLMVFINLGLLAGIAGLGLCFLSR